MKGLTACGRPKRRQAGALQGVESLEPGYLFARFLRVSGFGFLTTGR
jgi:hypothetical protein